MHTRNPSARPTTLPAFTPLHPDGLATLAIRPSSSSFDLFDEAAMRQNAVQGLIGALGATDGLGETDTGDLYGCFLAMRLLINDATALYEAAREAHQAEVARLQGGAQ